MTDEFLGLGDFGGGFYLFIGGGIVTEFNIGGDGARKEKASLGNVSDERHKVIFGVIFNVNTIDDDGAGGADEGGSFAGAGSEGDVFEDFFFGAIIGEVNVFEFDAGGAARRGGGDLFPVDFVVSMEDFIDTPSRNVGAGQDDKQDSEEEEGHDNLDGVLHKRHHVAKISDIVLHKVNANPDTEQSGAVKN